MEVERRSGRGISRAIDGSQGIDHTCIQALSHSGLYKQQDLRAGVM